MAVDAPVAIDAVPSVVISAPAPTRNEFSYCAVIISYDHTPSPNQLQPAWRLKIFLEEHQKQNVKFDEMSNFIIEQPRNGVVVEKNGKLSYIPNESYLGHDGAVIGVRYKETNYRVITDFVVTDNFEHDERAAECSMKEFIQVK